MTCPCDLAPAQPPPSGSASEYVVRVRSHAHPLACPACLEKHLSAAAVYAVEYAEDDARKMERKLAIGNLVCAEDHARALGRAPFAERIRLVRRAFAEDGVPGPVSDLLAAL